MRTYLVVIDETDEASLALRFASRRAMKTNSALHILALVESEDFVAWGGVQATLEEESRVGPRRWYQARRAVCSRKPGSGLRSRSSRARDPRWSGR